MLVKIPSGVTCRYYDDSGTNTCITTEDVLCLVIEEVVDFWDQRIYTVLMGGDLYEVMGEEVIHC